MTRCERCSRSHGGPEGGVRMAVAAAICSFTLERKRRAHPQATPVYYTSHRVRGS